MPVAVGRPGVPAAGEFASDTEVTAAVEAHRAATTTVHGFTNTATTQADLATAGADIDALELVNTQQAVFNVKAQAYGAAGDGVADDTQAIQAAIDAAGDVKGTVYIPPGTYNVSSTLQIADTGMMVSGAGDGSLLVWTGAAGFVIRANACDTWTIQNLKINCAAVGSGVALDCTSGTNESGRIKQVHIINPVVGVHVNAAPTGAAPQIDDWVVEDCRIFSSNGTTHATKGVYVDSQNSTGTIRKTRIGGIYDNGAAIEVKGNLVLSIVDCTLSALSDTGTAGVRFTLQVGAVHLQNVQAEQVGKYLHTTAAATASYHPITLTSCVINDPIHFDRRHRLITNGCHFKGSSGTTYPLIDFDDSRNIWVDIGSDFDSGAGRVLADYVSLAGTLDVITLIGTTVGASTDYASIPARVNYIGIDKTVLLGEIEVNGALNHDGTTVGLFGATPTTQGAAIPDATNAASAITQQNLLLAYLRTLGLIAA